MMNRSWLIFNCIISGACSLVIICAVVGSVVRICHPCDIASVGIDYHEGHDHCLPSEWQNPDCYNGVQRVAVRMDLVKDGRVAGFEFHYSDHKSDARPDDGHDSGCKEIGFNIVPKWYYRGFYGGLIVGLAGLPGKVPEWTFGGSRLLGTFGGVIGRDWWLSPKWAIRTEVRVTHTSDPLRGDRGKNLGGWVTGLTYRWR